MPSKISAKVADSRANRSRSSNQKTMNRKTKITEYQPGKIKNLVEAVAKIVSEHPDLASDPDRLHATLAINIPGYGKKDPCFNCGGNMKISVYTADLLDALLILAMARDVRHKQMKGMPFTEANRVHIPTLPVSDATRKRHSKVAYLGLIKQPPNISQTGIWVITSWGWKALRGQPVPKQVKYWRRKFLSRSEEMTTLTEMFQTHTDAVKRAIERRKAVLSDHRAEIEQWNPWDWQEYAGNVEDEIKV
jgi:hypothetical protein